MSFGSRLKDRREQLGITQPQLAEMLGVSKGAVGNYETDVNSPRAAILYKVFNILHCDANYLFQDEINALYCDNATPEEFHGIVKKYRSLDQSGQAAVNYVLNHEAERVQLISGQNSRISELEKTTNEPMRRYTYLHRIACAGTSFLFDDIPTDTYEAPYMEGADFIIGVSGNSMEPDLSDGDLLYVRKTNTLNYGDVGIFTIGNECYVKEFGKSGLISHNLDYDDIPGTEDIRIIGEVIGKVSV